MNTVVPLQSPTIASNQLGTLQNTAQLAVLGCRAQLIQKLTSAGMPTIKAIIEQAGGVEKDKGGRHPRSISTLLEQNSQHIRASFFLAHYIRALRLYGGERPVVHTDAFIRAMMILNDELPSQEFTPDHCFLVASLYHEKKIATKQCVICPKTYMYSTECQVIRTHVTSGDCPFCRELAAIKRGRSVVRIPDAKQQRSILGSFTQG